MRKIFIQQIFFLFILFLGQFQFALAQPDSNTVLAQGNPPLTQSIAFKSIDLLEWSLDVRFPAEQKSKIQQIFINSWITNNYAQIRSVLEIVDIHNKLSQMAPVERNNFKEKFRAILLENLRKNSGDELSQTVLAIVQPNNQNTKNPEITAPDNQTIQEDKSPNDIAKQNQINSVSQTDSEELWTFSQSAPLNTEQAKAILQKSTFVNTASVDNKSLTFEQAIDNTRKFLNEGVGPKAVTDFYATPEAKEVDSITDIAAGAMIRGLPTLAVAALLRAHELEPQEATHLVNLAAALSYIEMSHEALAILDSPIVKNGKIASPLGMGGKAGILNIRGFALVKLGRAKEGEEALRQAVAQSPQLIEAKTNLAFALWAQDDPKKKAEAAGLIAAVWRRIPQQTATNNTAERTPSQPEKSVSQEIPIEIFDTDEGSAANLDLSKGKRLRLPDLKIPSSPEESFAMRPKYMKLGAEVSGLIQKLEDQYEQLQTTFEERGSNDFSPRSNNARKALIEKNYKQAPPVYPFWEKARKAFINNNLGVNFKTGHADSTSDFSKGADGENWQTSQSALYREKINEIEKLVENEIPTACANSTNGRACEARVREKYFPLKCSVIRDAHSKWRSAIHDYDTAVRNYLQASYKYQTAVLADISDPLEHKLYQNQIETRIYREWLILVEYVGSTDDLGVDASKYCKARSNIEGEDLENLQAEKADRADRCPPLLSKGRKISIDLAVVSISMGCDSLGVELSGPAWLAPFISWEGKFKGGWISKYQGSTVGMGLKVKGKLEFGVVKAGASASGGIYVKSDAKGNLYDGGLKFSSSAGVSAAGEYMEGIKTGTGTKISGKNELSIVPVLRAIDSAVGRAFQ